MRLAQLANVPETAESRGRTRRPRHAVPSRAPLQETLTPRSTVPFQPSLRSRDPGYLTDVSSTGGRGTLQGCAFPAGERLVNRRQSALLHPPLLSSQRPRLQPLHARVPFASPTPPHAPLCATPSRASCMCPLLAFPSLSGLDAPLQAAYPHSLSPSPVPRPPSPSPARGRRQGRPFTLGWSEGKGEGEGEEEEEEEGECTVSGLGSVYTGVDRIFPPTALALLPSATSSKRWRTTFPFSPGCGWPLSDLEGLSGPASATRKNRIHHLRARHGYSQQTPPSATARSYFCGRPGHPSLAWTSTSCPRRTVSSPRESAFRFFILFASNVSMA
ncbi:hypothetical protein C8R47DRAFT_1235321 [Mycena vitilis]|nr:hypothetical protein C8R47DRAFT_1235321 [Mycena vitilis]